MWTDAPATHGQLPVRRRGLTSPIAVPADRPTPSLWSNRNTWTAQLTAANRQPALAVYAPAAAGGELVPFAVKVLTVDRDRISAITGFATPHVFPAFQLPASQPASIVETAG